MPKQVRTPNEMPAVEFNQSGKDEDIAMQFAKMTKQFAEASKQFAEVTKQFAEIAMQYAEESHQFEDTNKKSEQQFNERPGTPKLRLPLPIPNVPPMPTKTSRPPQDPI